MVQKVLAVPVTHCCISQADIYSHAVGQRAFQKPSGPFQCRKQKSIPRSGDAENQEEMSRPVSDFEPIIPENINVLLRYMKTPSVTGLRSVECYEMMNWKRCESKQFVSF
jgi:hypothetical protein